MFNFVGELRNHLPKFQKVLELGSKKGDDLKLLDEYYEVVASEDEKVKTRFLKDEFIDIRVILVDKIEVDTQKKFDCVFSNRIFDECNIDEIKQSFENQKAVLNKDGFIYHIFDTQKTNKKEITSLLCDNYKLIKSEDLEDIFYIIAKVN